MRKTISVAFCAMLILSLFAGCDVSMLDHLFEADVPQVPDYLCFTAEEENAPLKLSAMYDAPENVYFQYTRSLDGPWTDYTPDEVIILENIGDKVYFKAKDRNETLGNGNSGWYSFTINEKKIGASGNIMSLLDSDVKLMTAPDRAFQFLFANTCKKLTSAPELPATTLGERCYYSTFLNCWALEEAPELPATEMSLGCYQSMFGSCRSLIAAPEIPATVAEECCCQEMFAGCTALVSGPSVLKSEQIYFHSYSGMFSDCASLVQAPEIRATILAQSCCDDMFAMCESLEEAPDLMAPVLETNCYSNMFMGCASLSRLKVGFTEFPTPEATSGWLMEVPSTGTFICPASLVISSRIDSTVPGGWAVETF